MPKIGKKCPFSQFKAKNLLLNNTTILFFEFLIFHFWQIFGPFNPKMPVDLRSPPPKLDLEISRHFDIFQHFSTWFRQTSTFFDIFRHFSTRLRHFRHFLNRQEMSRNVGVRPGGTFTTKNGVKWAFLAIFLYLSSADAAFFYISTRKFIHALLPTSYRPLFFSVFQKKIFFHFFFLNGSKMGLKLGHFSITVGFL